MPTFTFTSPQGKTYDIEAPEGATREQAFQVLQSQINPNAKPAADKPLEDTVATVAGVPQRSETKQDLRQQAQGVMAHIKSWFQPREQQPLDAGEVAGAVAGGAAGGAVFGAAAPHVLQAGGAALQKVPFAPAKAVGTVARGVGAGMELIPLGERVSKGAAGGAVMAATEKGGEAAGLAPYQTEALSLAAGGVSDIATGYAAKQATKLMHFAASLGDARTLTMGGKRVLSEESAKALQKQLFGEKIPGYMDNLVGSENRLAVQQELRKADPELTRQWGGPQGVQVPQKVPGTGGPVGTAVGPVKGSEVGPLAQTARKAAGAQPVGEDLTQPASTIYRNRLFRGVTEAVRAGHKFSETPEFMEFATKVQTRVALGDLSQAEATNLLRGLAADRKGGAPILAGYAESVDNKIRKWGKPGETGGQTGAAAVGATTARAVREDLRGAYDKYLQSLGMDGLERKYRGAYAAEKLAEAKDKLPSFLAGMESPDKFASFARNMARDPQGKEFIQRGVMQHLVHQEPQNVLREFERLQKTLVQAELVTPAHLSNLRTAAEAVQRTADKGAQLRAAERFKQLVVMTAVEKVSGQVGGAAGRGAGED